MVRWMKKRTVKLLLAYFIYEKRMEINSAKLQSAAKSNNDKGDAVIEQMRDENLIISSKWWSVREKLEKIFGKQIEDFKII